MAPAVEVQKQPIVTHQFRKCNVLNPYTAHADESAAAAHFPAELSGTQNVGEREVKQIALKWIDNLNKLMTEHDYDHVENIFHTECWWRDLLSIKLDHSLLHTSTEIASTLKECGQKVQFQQFKLSPLHEPVLQAPLDGISWIQGFFEYETKIARGRGLFRLLPNTAGSQIQWKW